MKIEETLNKIIENVTGCYSEDLTPEANFELDLGCDSLDGVEIIIETEKAFNISIPDGAMELQTVGEYYTYVKNQLTQFHGTIKLEL